MTEDTILDMSAIDQLRQIGGNALVAEILTMFEEHGRTRVNAAIAAGQTGNLDGAMRSCHSLKSSAANIGARKLQQLSQDIEQAANDGNKEQTNSLLHHIEDAFQAVLIELKNVER